MNFIASTKIGFFILSLFISISLFYITHNGFRNEDFLNVLILTLILFLIIDSSFKALRQKEIENFAVGKRKKKITFDGIEKESDISLKPEPQKYMNPKINEDEIDESTDESSTSDKSDSKKNFRDSYPGKKNPIKPKPISSETDSFDDENSPRKRKQINENPIPKKDNDTVRDRIVLTNNIFDRPGPKEKIDEEEKNNKKNKLKDLLEPPNKKFHDKKLKQAIKMNGKKLPIDDQPEDDEPQGPPININVSYNNNRPTSINEFDSGDKGGQSQISDNQGYPMQIPGQPMQGPPNRNNNRPFPNMQGQQMPIPNMQGQQMPMNNNYMQQNYQFPGQQYPMQYYQQQGAAPVIPSNFIEQLAQFVSKGNQNDNLDKYLFSSGLEKDMDVQRGKTYDSIKNLVDGRRDNVEDKYRGSRYGPVGVNKMTENATLANLNQSYYPAYLQNPLNKDQPGTHIKSIFDKNRELEEKIKYERDYNNQDNREILYNHSLPHREDGKKYCSRRRSPRRRSPRRCSPDRSPGRRSPGRRSPGRRSPDRRRDWRGNWLKSADSLPENVLPKSDNVTEGKSNDNWMKSNYEVTMLKKILDEKNDPAPVLLESPWSEWAPSS